MTGDVWLAETYYDWLRSECFSEASERRQYEGVLRLLHDVPFYWTIWSDENRAGDALSYRQNDFLGFQTDLDRVDQKWLQQWAEATPSVLEVLLGMARRWNFYYEGSVPYYFGHMFLNLGLDRYPGRVLSSDAEQHAREKLDDWMSRQFQPNGEGSPFPLRGQHRHINLANNEVTGHDMTQVDIWGQMNAYSVEHFQ